MKKYKLIIIIAINIIFILVLFFSFEYIIWKKYFQEYTKNSILTDKKNIKFKYSLINPNVSLTKIKNYFT